MLTISRMRTSESLLASLFLFGLWIVQVAIALFLRAVLVLLIWQERARQRHRLQTLDDRMLRDIGLSRAAIDHEVSKPFWQG